MREYSVQAQPCEYEGTEFKSLTEARVAIFFDLIGVSWQYEPDRFIVREVESVGDRIVRHEECWYSPDFYLPDVDCLVEVKPSEPNDEEITKALAVCHATGVPLYFFSMSDLSTPISDVEVFRRSKDGKFIIPEWAWRNLKRYCHSIRDAYWLRRQLQIEVDSQSLPGDIFIAGRHHVRFDDKRIAVYNSSWLSSFNNSRWSTRVLDLKSITYHRENEAWQKAKNARFDQTYTRWTGGKGRKFTGFHKAIEEVAA